MLSRITSYLSRYNKLWMFCLFTAVYWYMQKTGVSMAGVDKVWLDSLIFLLGGLGVYQVRNK